MLCNMPSYNKAGGDCDAIAAELSQMFETTTDNMKCLCTEAATSTCGGAAPGTTPQDGAGNCLDDCTTEPKNCEDFNAAILGCAADCDPDTINTFLKDAGCLHDPDADPKACLDTCGTIPSECTDISAMLSGDGCAAKCSAEVKNGLLADNDCLEGSDAH